MRNSRTSSSILSHRRAIVVFRGAVRPPPSPFDARTGKHARTHTQTSARPQSPTPHIAVGHRHFGRRRHHRPAFARRAPAPRPFLAHPLPPSCLVLHARHLLL